MSSGGLLQLVAKGAQDTYLTSKPNITYFKLAYKKHTNFAIETKKQSFNACFDSISEITLPRVGDLVSNMYVHVTLPKIGKIHTNTTYSAENFDTKYGWVNSIGHVLIDYVELQIGGQQIVRHSGSWLDLISQLAVTPTQDLQYQNLVGRDFSLFNTVKGTVTNKAYNLYIPLQFFFCKNISQALPLIALQYHEVKIIIKWRPFNECWTSTEINCPDIVKPQSNICAELLTDYIYLDTDERKVFAQKTHEYLIEQVQHINIDTHIHSLNINEEINFNHPVKELLWTIQYEDFVRNNMNSITPQSYSFDSCGESNIATALTSMTCFPNNHFNYGLPEVFKQIDNTLDPIVNSKLLFNGSERYTNFDGKYFNTVQMYQYNKCNSPNGIYMYSFALKPNETKPSGACNFSRIDNVTLNIELCNINNIFSKAGLFVDNSDLGIDDKVLEFTNDIHLNVWAVNYNILRIMSGMGGLAYSN